MNDNVETVYGDEDFFKLFELLVDNKMEEIIQKIKQESKMRYNNMECYPSTDTDNEVDEKDE